MRCEPLPGQALRHASCKQNFALGNVELLHFPGCRRGEIQPFLVFSFRSKAPPVLSSNNEWDEEGGWPRIWRREFL